MLPFYNQQPFSYYPSQLNQNPLFMIQPQIYPLNSSNNFNFFHPQPFYPNLNLCQETILKSRVPPENNEKLQNPLEMEKLFSCNCINTFCRKEYCICLKHGEICSAKCGCFNCKNNEELKKKVEIDKKKSVSCNCKKSECAKRYCECFASGNKCGNSCNCTECKNN